MAEELNCLNKIEGQNINIVIYIWSNHSLLAKTLGPFSIFCLDFQLTNMLHYKEWETDGQGAGN